jgi:hypothetical protein
MGAPTRSATLPSSPPGEFHESLSTTLVRPSSASRRRQRTRWSMPVMLVHAMSAFSSHSTSSIRPPMSADPIRIRSTNRAPRPCSSFFRSSRVSPCQKRS